MSSKGLLILKNDLVRKTKKVIKRFDDNPQVTCTSTDHEEEFAKNDLVKNYRRSVHTACILKMSSVLKND